MNKIAHAKGNQVYCKVCEAQYNIHFPMQKIMSVTGWQGQYDLNEASEESLLLSVFCGSFNALRMVPEGSTRSTNLSPNPPICYHIYCREAC